MRVDNSRKIKRHTNSSKPGLLYSKMSQHRRLSSVIFFGTRLILFYRTDNDNMEKNTFVFALLTYIHGQKKYTSIYRYKDIMILCQYILKYLMGRYDIF